MPNVVSFCIRENGLLKEPFYVVENENNQNLTIVERHTGWYGTAQSGAIKESRFSVHVTPRHPTHSLIKQTFVSENFSRNRFIWTDAIKSKTGFVFIFHKICQELTAEKYSPKSKSRIVELGEYDTNKFTLQISVLVGPPDREFILYGFPNFCFVHHQFMRFRLTVFVSFLSLPANDHAFINHRVTQREEPSDPTFSRLVREWAKGHDEVWCVREYVLWRQKTLEGYLAALPLTDKITTNAGTLIDKEVLTITGRFFASASTTSVAYLDHARRMSLYLRWGAKNKYNLMIKSAADSAPDRSQSSTIATPEPNPSQSSPGGNSINLGEPPEGTDSDPSDK